MADKVWEKCSWCQGSGKESPGSQHNCGQCWGKGGKWVEKKGSAGSAGSGCVVAALAIGLGVLLSLGFGVSKTLAATGLF